VKFVGLKVKTKSKYGGNNMLKFSGSGQCGLFWSSFHQNLQDFSF